MIVRILNQGQWEISDSLTPTLNRHDQEIERAVDNEDQAGLTRALTALIKQVKDNGKQLPDGLLHRSDLILPDETATVAEVERWFEDGYEEDGIIPD